VKKILIVLAVGALVVGLTIAAVIHTLYYPNIGTIGPLTMYLDDDITDEIPAEQYFGDTPIDWEVCIPNIPYVFDNMTVVNIGDKPLTINLVTKNLPEAWILTWTDSAGNPIVNEELAPNTQVEGKLSLTIPLGETLWPEWGFDINGEE